MTGGNYGTQYGGIDAIIRVFNELDPKKLKGTIITVPVMHMPAFQMGMDRSPIDGLSLNSVFQGDPNGSITRRIAHVVFSEVIKKSQYHLDIRGGDLWEAEVEFASVHDTKNAKFDEENVSIAKILGLKYWYLNPYPRGTIKTEASLAGIHSVVMMAYKGLGTYDEDDIEKCSRGIHNLLKYLKMIEGKPEIPTKPIRMAPSQTTYGINVKEGGLLYLDVKFGDLVINGQKVGEIRNLKGETLEVLTSPHDGVIHAVFPKHVKQPGEPVLDVRALAE